LIVVSENFIQSAFDILEALNSIEILDIDKIKFYSALYRCSFLPRATNDVDGAYPLFAGGKEMKKTAPGHHYYDDFSLWDTYRALHPLLLILEPEKSADMMQSLADKYEQGGWMPIFPCWNSYAAAMIGDHEASERRARLRCGEGLRWPAAECL